MGNGTAILFVYLKECTTCAMIHLFGMELKSDGCLKRLSTHCFAQCQGLMNYTETAQSPNFLKLHLCTEFSLILLTSVVLKIDQVQTTPLQQFVDCALVFNTHEASIMSFHYQYNIIVFLTGEGGSEILPSVSI